MGGRPTKVVHFRDYIDEGFWKGPYGILISNQIQAVICEDGCNYVMRPGDIRTNAYTPNNPMSFEAYMSRYGVKHFNNYYYDLEKGGYEVQDHRVYTKNRRGKEKVYIRMLDGEIFKETTRGVKRIKPVPYKIKSW